MFPRRRFLGLRAIILILLAVGLLFIDHRLNTLDGAREQMAVLVSPIRALANWPVEFVRDLGSSLTSRQVLIKQNNQLKAEQLVLQAKLQTLLAVEHENTQLRQLLSSSYHTNDKLLVAEIVAVDLNVFSQQVLINKGTKDGVYVGQPVLDANGVMGQVVLVGPYTSQVLLITDTRSAVPVQDERNGVRSIAVGTGYSGQLRLLHVPDTTNIQQGDLMVTSGLGQHYPYGYPVGIVAAVRHKTGQRFAQIELAPKAHITRSRQVLLIWYKPKYQQDLIKPLPTQPDHFEGR